MSDRIRLIWKITLTVTRMDWTGRWARVRKAHREAIARVTQEVMLAWVRAEAVSG